MSDNTLDTAGAVGAYLGGNGYDPTVPLRQSVAGAIDSNPEIEAKLQQSARRTGVSLLAARAAPDQVKKQAALQQYDFAELAHKFPGTAQFLMDQDAARISHDDTGNLTGIEQTLSALATAAKYVFSAPGTKNNLMGDIGAGVQDANRGAAGVFRAAAEMAAPGFDWMESATDLGGNPFRRLAEGFGMIGAQNKATADRLSPPTSGIAQGGVSSGVRSSVSNLLTLPLALLPGGQPAALGAMSSQAGGQAYLDAREKGLSVTQALPFAASQAAIEYATEKLPLSRLIGDVKAGTGLFKAMVKNAALEIPGEQIATVLQDMNEWAVLHPEKPFSEYLKERPGAAAQTLIATVIGVGAHTSLMRSVQSVADAATGTERKAQQAEQTAQFVEQLHELVKASKVRERDATTFQQFIDSATEGGPVSDVYISAQALAQSGHAEDVVRASPSAAEQWATALQTGNDLRIPLGEYVANVAGEDFAQGLVEHLKTDPAGFSQAEAKDVMATHADATLAAVTEQLTQRAGEAQLQEGRQAVEQAIREQLAKANRFTPEVNSQYATLAGAFYATQAARLGITPVDLFERYPLRVQATSPVGRELLSQDTGQQRGSFDPSTLTVTLLKKADLSTTLHEFGHANLSILADIAAQPDAPPDIKADMATLLDWFGVKASPELSALDEWHAMTIEQQREAHEKFARGFEAYLFEGKAPSVELQSIFQRFRAWLLNVYRSLKALNVEVSDDVRGVMDRMLATADQIKDAEAAASMNMLFKTPEEAAKFGVDWTAYHAQGLQATQDAVTDLEARSLKDMQWLTGARSRALKRLQREAAVRRREVELEVTRDVMSQRVYRAWAFLTGKQEAIVPGDTRSDQITETSSARLRTKFLKETYGDAADAVWRTLSAHGMTSDTRGSDPDLIAEHFGYSSGDEMVQELAAAQTPDEAVRAETDQRMLERFGDLNSPQAIEAAADEAVHNLARARFVATELNALNAATDAREDAGKDRKGRQRTTPILPKAAREFAAQLIARLKVRDVKPGQYSAADARASREAEKALKAGDVAAAAVAKRNQLINGEAVKAARDALAEVDKALKYFARVERSDSIDADYRDQITQVLERYQLARETLKAADRRTSLAEWAAKQQEAGFVPDIPPALLAGLDRKSYRDMTVEELRGLVDTVKQIEHIGRLKSKLLTARDNRTYEQTRDGIVDSIVEHSRGRTANDRTPTTNTGRWLAKVRGFGAAHIKAANWARILDGDKSGPLWDAIVRTANERGDFETAERAKATTALTEIMAPVMKAGKMGGKGTFFPSISRSVNREGVITMALNTGNASNLQRLLGGEGWTIEQLRPVLDTLSADDWATVQKVWDYFESFRPQIGAKERRVYGKEPDWIDPTPVVTKHGTFKGGYFPVKYDPMASGRAEEHADAEGAKAALKGAYSTATTRRSFTKARAEEVVGRPLLYTLQGLYGGVNDVIHDLAWHEWLIDANRLMKSDRIDKAIRTTYGPDVIRQFKTWREAIAEGDAGSQEAIDSMSGWLRQGVGVAGLGFNVMSAAMQPLGLSQSIARVGVSWVGKGVMQYLAHPIDKTREANAKSDFMANRMRTRFRDLNELKNRVQGQTLVRERLNTYAFMLMLRAQQTVDVPTWFGAYERAMAEHADDSRAVAEADQAVIDSQGGGQTKDLAAIERGGPTHKLFTVFYSFMNTTLNNLVASGMSPRSAGRKAADVALLLVVPAVLGSLLKDALTPGDAGGDDDKLWRKLLGEQVSFLFGLLIGGREIADSAKALASGERGRDYTGPAGLRVIPDSIAFAKQAGQGEFDDAFRKAAINIIGDLAALPAAQINRTITGVQALKEGKTANPGAIVFGFQEPH